MKRIFLVLVIVAMGYSIFLGKSEVERREKEMESLKAMCAFNRSNDRYLGRVVDVSLGDSIGQYKLEVYLERSLSVELRRQFYEFTYPKNVTLRKCS